MLTAVVGGGGECPEWIYYVELARSLVRFRASFRVSSRRRLASPTARGWIMVGWPVTGG
jgi:hypothetical protein